MCVGDLERRRKREIQREREREREGERDGARAAHAYKSKTQRTSRSHTRHERSSDTVKRCDFEPMRQWAISLRFLLFMYGHFNGPLKSLHATNIPQ